MKKFTLTLSPKYVSKWDKWEALRELMQNVIDREYEHCDAGQFVKYFPEKQRLVIGNRHTGLEKRTLLMGETTKADNEYLIGQYGEGYKLAFLVLLRNGCRVRIRTGSEVWAPGIEFSKEYGADIMAVKVHSMKFSEDLTFEVNGIDKKTYNEFCRKCLHLNEVESKISTDIGEILLDNKFRGQIFVEGLFVCQFPNERKIRYGYNMKAKYIELDRDRKKVDTFNLFWEISRMYAKIDSTYASMVQKLIKENYTDICHLQNHTSKNNPLYKAICELTYEDFFAEHGKKAIPVKNQQEADFVKQKYNDLTPIVIKKDTVYKYITDSPSYSRGSKRNVPREETPYSMVKGFMRKHKKIMSKKITEAFKKELLESAREWRIR